MASANNRLVTEQNIFNYCISGDLKALKECAHSVGQVVHKNSLDGQTCLIVACRNGHLDVAEYLIDVHGADVEQVGVVEFEGEQVEGVPPLWCAAASGHLKLVELLVSRGADVNRTTITNSTALRAACFDGHEQVVRYLVEHGANIENPNRHGHTCLMISCYRRHDNIVEYLLSKNARVNRRSAKGNTALHDCTESGNLKCLQLLLSHGAIMRKDEYGQSPIMSGANAAFKKIVDYLSVFDIPDTGQKISFHEKAAAYDLLGASLFDRHSLVQDAVAAWFQAIKYRTEFVIYNTIVPLEIVHPDINNYKFIPHRVPKCSYCKNGLKSSFTSSPPSTSSVSVNDEDAEVTVGGGGGGGNAASGGGEEGAEVQNDGCVVNREYDSNNNNNDDERWSLTNISPKNCWSLLSLAAREAVGLSEYNRKAEQSYSQSLFSQRNKQSTIINQLLSRRNAYNSNNNNNHNNNNSQYNKLSSTKRQNSSQEFTNIYKSKYEKLKLDLQNAYQCEFERLGHSLYRSNSIRDYTTSDIHSASFCSAFLQGAHNSRLGLRSSCSSDYFDQMPVSPTTSISSTAGGGCGGTPPPTSATSSSHSPTPVVSSHPNGVFIQSVLPVDPILGFEPKCCQIARYRRWLLEPVDDNDHGDDDEQASRSGNTRNNNAEQMSVTKYINQCTNCQRILVSMNNVHLMSNNDDDGDGDGAFNESVCPICKTVIKDSSGNCSGDDKNGTKQSTTSTGNGHVSATESAEDSSMYICPQCHLATEDHPLIRRLKQCGEEAFGHVCEFRTHEELASLMSNTHVLRLQSLLIRLRILGPDHPDTIYFIRYRGAIYADADNFHQCLSLWRYALELQRTFLEPLCHVSQAAFVSFAELFHFVLTNSCIGLPAIDLNPTLIVDCLELAIDNIERGMDYSFYHWHHRHPWSYTAADKEAINLMRHVSLCLHFIAMILIHYGPNSKALPNIRPLRRQLTSGITQVVNETFNDLIQDHTANLSTVIPNIQDLITTTTNNNNSSGNIGDGQSNSSANEMKKRLSPELLQRFFRQVYRLVKLDPRVHRGQSLIHLACSPETSTVGRFMICPFPNVNVLSLLFELGADANCADVDGQRPIGHVLAQRRLKSSDHASLIKTLVKCGAHLDATNRNSQTVLYQRFQHILAESHVQVLNHVTLACHAARVANRYGLTASNPSVQAYLPSYLLSFLQMHQ
ncbi:unnamed protein product [Trichobilharzia szidati]|nr:unnamed protein product [Trichobilharzia szidati]